jgi:threonine dehydrogenase-like Zn-dependent dehydrogenase
MIAEGFSFKGFCVFLDFFDSLNVPVNLYRRFNTKELVLLGSWASTPPEHFDLLRLIKRGLSADGIITHTYPIDDDVKAFKIPGAKGAMKPAIYPRD